MHRLFGNRIESHRLRRSFVATLVVVSFATAVWGQKPAILPARGPSYPTPAADPAPTSSFGKFKQTFSSLPKLFNKSEDQSTAGRAARRRVSPRSRNSTESTVNRNPLSAIKKTFNKAFPHKESRDVSAALRGTRLEQFEEKVKALRPPASSPAVPGLHTRQSRPTYAGHAQRIKSRQSRFPPAITFKSSPPAPTGRFAQDQSQNDKITRTASQSDSRNAVRNWPAYTRGNRSRESIEWASGADDPPPLPAGSPGAEGKPPRTIDVPLTDAALEGRIQISTRNGRISLTARDAPLEQVLDLIAQQQGLNIVTSGGTPTNVSAALTNVDLDDALSSILSVAGYTWTRQRDIIVVSPVTSQSPVAPDVQGLVLRVFPLNFVAAADVQLTVTGLLSLAGKSFISESLATDKRRTRDILVVEDLPGYVQRVEQYIAQVDQPPRQVLIEAHVLRVDLSAETRHGVDFNYISHLANTQLTLRTQGFTNPVASPAFFLGIDGTDVDALVEAIQDTTDAKTLASPKVLAVNGQEARIQIGERFGYLVTTTTETSTLQNVDFLDVGVVMSVTPQISDDNQVLMTVKPEVSSGRINVLTGLPEEETTEVSSTVMLPDGHGIVIGGLIQETDADRQSKIPILGDLWLVGRLFQRNSVVRERSEIVIALVPRIVPYGVDYNLEEERDFVRATTPLVDGALWKTDRPWEPVMPDAVRNPRRIRVNRIPDAIANLHDPAPYPIEYYFATRPEIDHWVPPFISLGDHDYLEAAPAEGHVILPEEEVPPFDE